MRVLCRADRGIDGKCVDEPGVRGRTMLERHTLYVESRIWKLFAIYWKLICLQSQAVLLQRSGVSRGNTLCLFSGMFADRFKGTFGSYSNRAGLWF